jgi:UDP-N-acetylglucosamine--N-acetylmuramyl-(pentapeptide) pyrophosphoryl-undecaprenol N-acetylglucosamine transferase
MRVLIAGGGTGGHLMPALALADALVEVNPAVEPVLVGAKRGVEASILPSRPYRHYLLPLQPIYRNEWWKNWRWPLLALEIKTECDRVLDKECPVLALGTGGYAAGPMLHRSYRRGIQIAIQEQNAYPGLTTRWLSRKARQVHLGYPEAASFLRPGRSTTVHEFGNPITPPPSPRPDRHASRAALGIPPDLPVLLVVGGSQGASRINQTIAELVDSGAFRQVVLLWSTGHGTWDKYSRFAATPDRIVKPFWDPVTDAYAAADVVVSRAGAMTTAELCAWGLPAILIPLPSAAADHQGRNARALAKAGAAVHLSESDLSPQRLEQAVSDLLEDPAALEKMQAAAIARGRPDAARRIAKQVLGMVS